MSHIPAVKTMKAIDAALEADQGNKYRSYLKDVLPHISDAYRQDNEGYRTHLGASLIGRECSRELWLTFRWAKKPHFNGKMLRLFNRGHLEEGRCLALLLMIGVQVYQQDSNGNQFRISDCEGHFGGSTDGVAVGIPDLPPGMACLTEFKTHNEKSFCKVEKEGVREGKFEHYVQMQIYMYKMGLGAALYFAVNKDNDAIYAEIVPINSELAELYINRATKLINLMEPPLRIAKSLGFFKCKWCLYNKLCFLREPAEVNCRTCKAAAPTSGKAWFCAAHNTEISKETQLVGCADYQPLDMTI